jgi:hypothetical protein
MVTVETSVCSFDETTEALCVAAADTGETTATAAAAAITTVGTIECEVDIRWIRTEQATSSILVTLFVICMLLLGAWSFSKVCT